MSDLHHPPPTSLCCCRKSLPVPGCTGGSGRPLAAGGPVQSPVCPPQQRRLVSTHSHTPIVDVASASNFSCFALKHFHLDLRINFAVKELSGWCVLDIVLLQPGTQTLVLDSHPSVLIHAIDCKTPEGEGEGGEREREGGGHAVSLTYRMDPFTDYGSALCIALPPVTPGNRLQVTVRYTTTDGPAVWWLDPSLTCGQTRPLLFTLGHSVCNRSLFPCFDTPAVKSTYTATVRVPEGVTVLMSASQSSYSKADRVFQFNMEFPVPSYLVALVAGELQHVDIGPRSRVWAEPCLLQCAVKKLGGSVERWLGVAEQLFGPYLWGRCDIVFLPPSFPIVAMENPCLTFIIASILESSEFLLIDVVHEISHGWFGNAVTNASWEEMWLSEGLATYAQRRITTEIYGEAFTCLETAVRLDALHRQLRLLGDNNPVSKLQVKFEPGVNPSSLMNLFTYEKGFCFVSYLSHLCGDVRRFDCFLKDYISQFKFRSVVSQDLIDHFLDFFPELQEAAVAQRDGLEFSRWLSSPGPPLYEPDLSAGDSLTRPVTQLCEAWTGSKHDVTTAMATTSDLSDTRLTSGDLSCWSSFQIVLFLDRLLDQSPLDHDTLSHLSLSYSSLFDSLNAEVQIRWFQIVVRNGYYDELPRVKAFLHKHTSRMYTVPLYDDLVAGVMKCVAVEMFNQTQRRMHPNLRRTLQQIVCQNNTVFQNTSTAETAVNTVSAVSPSTNQNGSAKPLPHSPNSSPPQPQTVSKPSAPTAIALSIRDVNVSA